MGYKRHATPREATDTVFDGCGNVTYHALPYPLPDEARDELVELGLKRNTAGIQALEVRLRIGIGIKTTRRSLHGACRS